VPIQEVSPRRYDRQVNGEDYVLIDGVCVGMPMSAGSCGVVLGRQ